MKNKILLHWAMRAALLATFVLPISVRALPGDLYVGNGSDILKFSPVGKKTTFATDLAHPVGLAFNQGGHLFVADNSAVIILEFDAAGNSSVFASDVHGVFGMAFDGAGSLFVGDTQDDVIWKFTSAGVKTQFVSGLDQPGGLAFDESGNLYEADTGSHTIFKFSPAGTRTVFASGLGGPYDLAFDRLGNLFVADGSDGIIEFTPLGEKKTFASGFTPLGLAFDDEGNLFAVDIVASSIFKFTPAGVKTTFAAGLFSVSFFLAFEPITEKLRNISARGLVGTGDEVLIGGFIVGGNALANNSVVARAIGPSLSDAGVSNALADPVLELHDASGAIIAANDDWQDTQKDQIKASGLAPTNPKESAIFATLPAGNYTAVVRGAGDATGVALVEIFSVNQ